MDNFTIARILGASGCKSKFDVVAADELPATGRGEWLEPGNVVIANTDVAGQPGTHWVVFFTSVIDGGRNSEPKLLFMNYFDPLGECRLEFGKFREFVNNGVYDALVSNHNRPVQFDWTKTGVYSDSCALHCMHVALEYCEQVKRHGKSVTLDDVIGIYKQATAKDKQLIVTNENECRALSRLLNRYVEHSAAIGKIVGCYTNNK